MQTSSYVAFLVAALVIILVPGPTNLTIVSDSMNGGLRKSLWTVLGSALSHAAFIVATSVGLGTIVTAYPRALLFIKWFGVAYLAFQGARLILKRPSLLDSDSQTRSSQSSLSYLIRGFLVNSTNPKALLFYAALFPPFLSANAPLIPQLSILAATFLGIFIVVGVLHALLGSRAGLILQNGRRMNLENKISGAVMIGAAVWIATK